MANLGGFFGPQIVGAAPAADGGFSAGYWVMAGVLPLGGLLTLFVPTESRQQA